MKSTTTNRTKHPNQTLSEHAIQGRNKVVGLDTHVQEAANHIDDVVRVNGGEHQVPGQGRLNRDLRRLFVANFTDHDLVRIVAQNRTQPAREGQTFFLVDRNLRNAVQLILDRVFDG